MKSTNTTRGSRPKPLALLLAAILSLLGFAVAGTPVHASASQPAATMASVRDAVTTGRSMTAAERHLLAAQAGKVMHANASQLEGILGAHPEIAFSLPVREQTVVLPANVAASPTANPLAAACWNSTSRGTTKYTYNVTNSKIARFSMTKYFDYDVCGRHVNDDDFLTSDKLSGYVYGPFVPFWSYDGVSNHTGNYYTFQNVFHGGHSSTATGKFSACLPTPIGCIGYSNWDPNIKINGHWTGSSAVY